MPPDPLMYNLHLVVAAPDANGARELNEAYDAFLERLRAHNISFEGNMIIVNPHWLRRDTPSGPL